MQALWASIVECCALLTNIGVVGDGEADGVSKFGSEEQAKRLEEFAPIARFFAENASGILDDVGGALLIHCAPHGTERSKSMAPLWPQTPRAPCTGLRELAERITLRNTPFCDDHAYDRYQGEGFRRS